MKYVYWGRARTGSYISYIMDRQADESDVEQLDCIKSSIWAIALSDEYEHSRVGLVNVTLNIDGMWFSLSAMDTAIASMQGKKTGYNEYYHLNQITDTTDHRVQHPTNIIGHIDHDVRDSPLVTWQYTTRAIRIYPYPPPISVNSTICHIDIGIDALFIYSRSAENAYTNVVKTKLASSVKRVAFICSSIALLFEDGSSAISQSHPRTAYSSSWIDELIFFDPPIPGMTHEEVDGFGHMFEHVLMIVNRSLFRISTLTTTEVKGVLDHSNVIMRTNSKTKSARS